MPKYKYKGIIFEASNEAEARNIISQMNTKQEKKTEITLNEMLGKSKQSDVVCNFVNYKECSKSFKKDLDDCYEALNAIQEESLKKEILLDYIDLLRRKFFDKFNSFLC